MYWAGFGINGTTPLVEIHSKSNSLDYQDVLGQNIVRRGSKIAGRGWIFQHDNAAIHCSASTKDYLERNGVRVLDWPSRSPDLNLTVCIFSDFLNFAIIFEHMYFTKNSLSP